MRMLLGQVRTDSTPVSEINADNEANKAPGTLTNWPKATPESEQWRYTTIKQCREASNDASDPRSQAYNAEFANAVADISRAVGYVFAVDDKTTDDVRNIIRLAIKFWLDLASQRCRLVIVLQSADGNLLSGQRAGRKPQDLVVQPEIHRFGNSHGEDLQLEETLKSCMGEVRKFKPLSR
jgi:hypothetical protein